GYYCTSYPSGPSIRADPFECGGVDRFCPAGSSKPTAVDAGYYTVGGGSNNRTRVAQCEPGYYCNGGIKFRCPAGTFGIIAGLYSGMCSGYCPKGSACPEGSASPEPCEEGTYAVGGAITCSSCPGS
ncbi:unnamed protein product, partial [Discosporangium mesarthrocarpum]